MTSWFGIALRPTNSFSFKQPPKKPDTPASSTPAAAEAEADFVGNLKKEINTFTSALMEDPVKAVQKYPLHTFAMAIVSLLVISVVNSVLGGGAKEAEAPAPKAKAEEKKEQKEEEKKDEDGEEKVTKRKTKKVADDE